MKTKNAALYIYVLYIYIYVYIYVLDGQEDLTTISAGGAPPLPSCRGGVCACVKTPIITCVMAESTLHHLITLQQDKYGGGGVRRQTPSSGRARSGVVYLSWCEVVSESEAKC